MAVGLVAAVVLWMLSGLVGDAGTSTPAGIGSPSTESGAAPDREALPVTVARSKAAPVVREIVVSGRIEPNRIVEVKAETEGRIVALGVERGRPIRAGELIARIDVRDREAAVAEAEKLVEHRRLQHQAAMSLEGQRLIAEVQIAEAAALLATAEAQLERARLDLARTSITAPFDGVLDERDVELGDYVGIGDSIGRVADIDPLLAVGEISEREIGFVEVGMPGRAQLADGTILEGIVRYVSPVADSATRTFRVEIALPNPEHRPAGTTAELRIPAREIEAHFLSPAVLTLDEAGNIGVKIVDVSNKVRFHEVAIVRSASDGIWVTGLPDEALVITVGQGFVAVGETVKPVPAESSAR
ncbi:MAG: efflux RND transporter periplasmic adaptor subunit [Gammaproteobacteria bacterium]